MHGSPRSSALCVTGLSTLDVPNHWSGQGELTILVLIQLGGLGIMSASVLIVALFSRTMGFGIRRGLAAENSGITPGNVRPLLKIIVAFTFTFEAIVALGCLAGCGWPWTADADAAHGTGCSTPSPHSTMPVLRCGAII
jgi:Trk-type K+ transport system membrane component